MNIIEVKLGFVVELERGAYIGVDGFIARDPANANPFRTYHEAVACAEAEQDRVYRRWR
jgi:hypothetical protein